MSAIIETNNLNFYYGKHHAIQNLNLEVPESSIYGFLGPNGAGKSTTIKLLLGLLKSGDSNIFVFGKEFIVNRYEILAYVGCLIESPSLYRYLTAYESLRYLNYIYQVGEDRINSVLKIVGLWEDRNKKVRQFSSGMKQRLGIGISMLHCPKLLILDEPINGLDPKGVVEIRELLLRLQDEGTTIFISSHILSEVEKLCTHLGIINQGNLIYQGSMAKILSNSTRNVSIQTSDNNKTSEILTSQFKIISKDQNMVKIIVKSNQDFNKMIYCLTQNQIEVFNMETVTGSLEDIFIDLTLN